MSRRTAYHSTGSSRVYAIQFEVATDVTADATDHWKIDVYHLRDGQTTGERIGSTFSFATRDLDAGNRGSIYGALDGLLLADGEEVIVVGTEVGAPAALDGFTVYVDVERLRS